jgi:diguanylate cyclase (GGDEF)-like protein
VLRALLAREGSARWLLGQVASDAPAYAYLTLSTIAVFVLLGRLLGKKEDLLEATATTDALTGLANRRHFDARLGEELARAARHGGSLSLLLMDVDGLKVLNDRGGHEAGDEALRAVGEALQETCRRIDLPARVGGDEFAVLAPMTTAEQAVELANRIRQTLASLPGSRPGRRPSPTISIGVADTDKKTPARPEDLYAAADRALYAAKAAGRDRVIRAGS